MKKTTLTIAALLVLAACGGSETSTDGTGETLNLTGAGATFPYPMYSKWFSDYAKQNPGIQINYQSLGSGAGVRQVTDGTVDFGATDGPMNEEQLAAYQTAQGHGVLHLPTVLGAVVPTYNLDGVDHLNFTGEALAGIFLGKIKKWNDPALAAANPDVKLPAADIVVVHRSDGSGTTFIWTDYLSKVSPDWAAGPGNATSVSWPAGVGGKGNDGVAGLVKQTPNSIGYVEMIYAVQNNMATGMVRNSSGNFVAPTLEAVTAAASGIEMPADFRVSITNPTGADAYPISSFTWLLIPERVQDAAKREALVGFLEWMLGPGQSMTSALEYAPLPASVVEQERAVLASIQ